jgi:hypothetical protein
VKEAIVVAQKAQRLLPNSAALRHFLGRLYYFDCQPENAMYEWYNATALDRDHHWSYLFRSFLELEHGDYDAWYRDWRMAMVTRGVDAKRVAQADGMVRQEGVEKFARWLQNETAKEARRGNASPLSVAYDAMRSGAPQEALQWVDLALERRATGVIYLGVDPAFASLRGNPVFEKELARLHLPPTTTPPL